jgi:hypothetical protein
MSKYLSGKIYKIISDECEQIYIGSTCEELDKRFDGHMRHYTSYLAGKYNYVSSFDILRFEDARIELIELYSCNSKAELEKKEGEHVRNNNCVNMRIPGRSKSEYRVDNRERLSTEEKKYYQKNIEKINERLECCCGKFTTRQNASQHRKSKFHINFIDRFAINGITFELFSR